ncbi:MAG: OmpA family protein [Planctomycetes bacterium]|nr:OmpA family protein [Planctomycetota bacterium]
MAKKHKKHEHVNHERWLVSYADFITLLFAFFVVMFAVSQVDTNKVGRFTQSVNSAFQTQGIFAPSSGSPLERGGSAGSALVPSIVNDRPSLFRYAASSPRAQAVKEALEERIDAAGLGSLVGLRYDTRGVALSLPESLYFRAGTANLRTESLANMAEIAKAVAAQPGAIVVEGHTDDLPVRSPLFTSNWELSAARAARVVRYLIEEGGLEGQRLSAVGLSDTRPLVENIDELTREANRRVQIVIVTEASE